MLDRLIELYQFRFVVWGNESHIISLSIRQLLSQFRQYLMNCFLVSYKLSVRSPVDKHPKDSLQMDSNHICKLGFLLGLWTSALIQNDIFSLSKRQSLGLILLFEYDWTLEHMSLMAEFGPQICAGGFSQVTSRPRTAVSSEHWGGAWEWNQAVRGKSVGKALGEPSILGELHSRANVGGLLW